MGGVFEVQDFYGTSNAQLARWADEANHWVRPEHRGRGIGTWLVQQGCAWLRLGGKDRLLAYAIERRGRGAEPMEATTDRSTPYYGDSAYIRSRAPGVVGTAIQRDRNPSIADSALYRRVCSAPSSPKVSASRALPVPSTRHGENRARWGDDRPLTVPYRRLCDVVVRGDRCDSHWKVVSGEQQIWRASTR